MVSGLETSRDIPFGDTPGVVVVSGRECGNGGG